MRRLASGLRVAEYDFFLGDELNYHLWYPAQYQARADRDPAFWLPDRNRCWFLRHYVATKERWALTMDSVEHDSIQDVLALCSWDDLEPSCGTQLFRARVVPETVPAPSADTDRMVAECDANLDGRISCAEVWACGAPAPVVLGDALYPVVADVDDDGVACR